MKRHRIVTSLVGVAFAVGLTNWGGATSDGGTVR